LTRDELLEKGWRRHRVISLSQEGIDALASELPIKIMEMISVSGAIALVTTYDCAVVYGSFEDEPWVQLLVAVPTDFKKELSKGRDSRRLHFTVMKSGEDRSFEASARGICQIDRELLLKLEVDDSYTIDDPTKFDLKQWVAERFRQDTWPDAFNKAVGKRARQLKRLYARYNGFISGLYVRLDTYEELNDSKYTISIIVIVEAGKWRDLYRHMREVHAGLKKKGMDELNVSLANEVLTAFGDTVVIQEDRTIEVLGKSIEIKDETQITLHQLRRFGRLSPYSLSEYGTDAPTPAEMTAGRASH